MLTKKCIRCISRDSSLFYSSGFGLSVSGQCQENLQKLAPRRVRRRPFEGVDLARPLLPLRMGELN